MPLTSANNLWPTIFGRGSRPPSENTASGAQECSKTCQSHSTVYSTRISSPRKSPSSTDASELPSDHPNKSPEHQPKGKEKWDAVMSVQSVTTTPRPTLYSTTLYSSFSTTSGTPTEGDRDCSRPSTCLLTLHLQPKEQNSQPSQTVKRL